MELCAAAPQFYKGVAAGRRSNVLEAHMDDMHGGGSDAELPGFFEKLHYVAGESYDHLKRHRRRTHEGIFISPHPRCVAGVAQFLGLDGCKSVVGPSVIGKEPED